MAIPNLDCFGFSQLALFASASSMAREQMFPSGCLSRLFLLPRLNRDFDLHSRKQITTSSTLSRIELNHSTSSSGCATINADFLNIPFPCMRIIDRLWQQVVPRLYATGLGPHCNGTVRD